MTRAIVNAVVLFAALATVAGCGPIAPAPDASDVRAELVAAHNRERETRGYGPLRWDARLQVAAQAHADFMATKGRMAHSGIGDGSPASRAQAAGYPSMVAENVAWNSSDVPSTMRMWMNSPGHRRSILGNYADVGCAVAYGRSNDPYWCAIFGGGR